jgi:hypothetical protein
MRHDRRVAMDFYVGPAVLTLDSEALDVTAYIDSSAARGLYIWGGFLDTRLHPKELRFQAAEADKALLALPECHGELIDVVYTSAGGIGFLGIGPSPLKASG